MSLGKYFSGSAALVVLFCFFLPWISVSCGGQTLGEFNGYDMATGTETLEADAKLFLLPLAAIVVIGLIIAVRRHMISEQASSISQIAASITGFAVLALKWNEISEGLAVNIGDAVSSIFGEPIIAGELGVTFSLEYGVLGTVLGLLFIIIGAAISIFQARSGESYGYIQTPSESVVRTVGMPSPPPMSMSPPDQGYPGMPGSPDLPGAAIGPTRGLDQMGGPGSMFQDMEWAAPGRTPLRTEVLHPEKKTMAWLVVREGTRAGHQFHLFVNTGIGRDADNEVVLDDTSLSGRHARIKMEEGHFYLYDMASTNGTFFFNAAQNEWVQIYRQELNDGDQIKLGRQILHFMTIGTGEGEEA